MSGRTIDGIKITDSGLLAGTHLVGHGELQKFLKSHGKIIPTDRNRPPTAVTTYIKKFGGYNFTYDSKTKSFVNSPNQKAPAKQSSSLHKSALAIGRAHSTTVAPIPKSGSGKQSSARAPTYASTGAAQLDIAKLSKIAAAVFPMRKKAELSAPATIGRRFYFSSSKNVAAARFVSKTVALAQAPYSASTAAGMLRVAQQSTADGMFGAFLQNRPSSVLSLNRGLPVSIAPIGRSSRRVTGGANVGPVSPQFASAASSSQNEASSGLPYQTGQNTNWHHEFSEFLDRQARLPPNGGPGFDRRLSPAWAGLKLSY